jgi:hypothetical protein
MRTKAIAMLNAYPGRIALDKELLAGVIDTCLECAQSCTACADADLAEPMIADLTRCIRLDLDCADICEATARVLTRQTAYERDVAQAVLRACVLACKLCGDECDRHAKMHPHCAVCAEVCHRCEELCEQLLAAA